MTMQGPEVVISHGSIDEGLSKARRAAIAEANRRNGFEQEPLPLFPPPEEAQPYPLRSLGALRPGVEAIAVHVQVPPVMAAQSVLAAAAVGVQALVNVQLPFGQTRPTSLMALTIAESGDRKATSDNEANAGLRERERHLAEIREAVLPSHLADLAAYHGEKKRIENDRKINGREARKTALEAIGAPPPPLLEATLSPSDATVEGLIKEWPNLQPSLGLFTTEGGIFTEGAAMSPEMRGRTAGALNALWDGATVTKLRAGTPIGHAHGKRLSLHAMIQPRLAGAFLGAEDLRSQGFLARFLVAQPASLAGTRLFRRPTYDVVRELKDLQTTLHDLLATPWPVNRRNELEPDIIRLDTMAEAEWIAYHDEVESAQRPKGRYHALRDVAAKSGEQACRLAAILAVVANRDSRTIDATTMADGLTLARWYLDEARRLQRNLMLPPAQADAHEALNWLLENPDKRTTKAFMQFGPGRLRAKAKADAALGLLAEHGWLRWPKKRPAPFFVYAPIA